MSPDPHIVVLLGFGLLVLLVAWLPPLLDRLPLSLPIVCVSAGFLALFGRSTLFDRGAIDRHTLIEQLAEAVLLIALMGAGLNIDRPVGWRRWASTWRLLGIAMPLTIVCVSALAYYWGHFALPAALLLGGALAPTDPVLASDVSVGPPGRGDEGEVRFALTSEAGLNDGLAFPFISLALLAAAGGDLTLAWVADHFLWRVALSIALGVAIGRGLGSLQFRLPRVRSSETGEGIAALGVTFVAFATTEALGGYGFIAVFLCALSLRAICPDSKVHAAMADFAGQVERLLAMIVILLFGGALGAGLLAGLSAGDAAIGVVILLVVRPATAWIALLGSPHSAVSRAATAFFGIRGIGTLYYMIYAFSHGPFEEVSRLWALVGFVVLGSIVVHGLSSTPLMQKLDEMRAREKRARKAS